MKHPRAVFTLVMSALALAGGPLNASAEAEPKPPAAADPLLPASADALDARPDADSDKPLAAELRIYWENDGTLGKRNNPSDRHRTNGTGFSIIVVPSWHDELAKHLPFAASFDADAAAIGGVAGQVFYTPSDLTTPGVVLGDRPYAGHLFGGVFVQRYKAWPRESDRDMAGVIPPWSTMDHFQLNLGVLGPESLSEDTQRSVHDWFDETDPKGWDNQIDQGVQIQAYLRKAWRYYHQLDQALGIDVMPDVGVALGTTFRHAEAGVTARFGVNLPANFGEPELMRPTGISAGQRGLSLYTFARASGRAVQYDATLDEGPTGIESEPLVGKLRAGIAVGYQGDRWRFDLGYSQTFMTEDFKQQRGGDSFGQWTAALAARF